MLRVFRKLKGVSETDTNKFIFKAALNQDPIFDAYKKLCKIRGEMDYVDFEWRYYQFFHGNQDLTIERGPSNSSPVTFSDLPMDVLEKVIGELNLVDRLILRKVCPDLRNLVDSTEAHCENINFHLGDFYSNIKFGSFFLGYKEATKGGCIVDSNWKRKKYKDHRDFNQVMASDVLTFLKNSKLQIGTMEITVDSIEAVSKFVLLLKSLSFQLNVHSVTFYTNFKRSRLRTGEEYVLPILLFLMPTTLEQIIFSYASLAEDQINQIMNTEQWRKARKFICYGCPQMESILNFKELEIKVFEFTEKNLIMVRDILLKSTHLEQCSLEDSCPNGEADELRIQRVMSQNPGYDAKTCRFSIPNSNDYFQLSIEIVERRLTLTIKKVFGN